jgi:hypothetical protein
MQRRLLASLLIAGALPGCSSASRPQTGIRTSPLPDWALAACASVPGLRASCAGRQPWVRSGVHSLVVVRATRRWPFSYLVLRHGVDAPGAGPPAFATVVAGTGPAGGAAREFGLSPAVRRPVSAWLAPGPRALDAGPRRWGGLAGRLFLTRSTGPSEFRDLIAFAWRDGGQRRVIAIGAWGPFSQAVATLRTIVRRRPRATGDVSELVPAAPVGGIAMISTPRWVRLLCRRAEPRACPAVLPRPGSAFALVQAGAHFLDVAWGGATGRPRRDRPPRLVHLTVADGAGARGCYADHVCRRWTAGARRHLVSLHAWSPRREALAVFAAVVHSIAGAP